VDGHPVRLVVADDLQRSRLTVFFRLLLALPHFVWIGLWSFAVLVLGLVAWVAALVRGRLPQGLHEFMAMYVRYITHVAGYISLAANPYPGFTGQPGYPLDVELPDTPERQSRWSIGFRLLLALPALLVAGALGTGGAGNSGGAGVAAVCALLGWFAILAVGRMPVGLRDLAAYGLGYTAHAYAYALLVTDRYPNSDPDAIGPAWELPPHPVRLALEDDGRRSRLMVFFRLLFAIPHFVWLALWSIAAFLAAIANGLVALFRGRSADALHRFLAAYLRYYAHVTAFVSLVANPFPGFTGDPGYPVDIVVDPPERQNRWITFFRVFLAIPAFILSGALSVALFLVAFLGWFAALATGRMPNGLRNLGAYVVRYLSQTNAYWFVVTDTYPHSSPGLRPRAEPEPGRAVDLVPGTGPEPEPA
jgi:hypothetical protein